MPLTYWWIPYTLILGTYYSNLNTIMYLGKLTNVLMHWPSWILTLHHFLWGRYPLSYNSLAIMIWSLLSIEKVTAAIWMKHGTLSFHRNKNGWLKLHHPFHVSCIREYGKCKYVKYYSELLCKKLPFLPLFPI